MATGLSWKLRRYGRLAPKSQGKETSPWKIFESKGNNPVIELTISDSGYVLVLQGKESLDTIPLVCGSDSLKVYQKSDNLFFRLIVKGESRMMRMQFDGSTTAEAINECSNAVEKLMKYVPVTSQGDAPPPPNQPPTEVPAPAIQTCREAAVGVEPEVIQGTLTMNQLIQHYLGETTVTLPQEYHLSSLSQVDLEPILRTYLLDPSLNAFVEKMERELRKMLEE